MEEVREDNYTRKSRYFVVAFAVAALFAGVFGPVAMEKVGYTRAYQRAEAVAGREYGDRDGKLSDVEREAWFRDMDVTNGRPTKSQLQDFLKHQGF